MRLDKAVSGKGRFKDVVMVEQLVRDKLNEMHKRAKAVEKQD